MEQRVINSNNRFFILVLVLPDAVLVNSSSLRTLTFNGCLDVQYSGTWYAHNEMDANKKPSKNKMEQSNGSGDLHLIPQPENRGVL